MLNVPGFIGRSGGDLEEEFTSRASIPLADVPGLF